MKHYVSDIVKSYEDTIIRFMEKSVTPDLLLSILHCWFTFDVDEDNQELFVFMYCSEMT